MLKPKSRLLKRTKASPSAAAAPPPPPDSSYEKALQIDRSHLEGQVRHFEREVRSMRLQLAEKDEALGAYQAREAASLQTLESLRARLAAYQGVRELTEATETANGSLRGQLKDAYEASARSKSELDATAALLGQSCDEAARARDAAERLSVELARCDGERREAEAALARAAEDVAASKVLLGDTEQRLRSASREADELRARCLDLERARAEAAAAEDHARGETLAARRACDVAEADARAARDRAWEHHLKVAETKALGVDLQRLVRLLASTREYRAFGALWRDSDVDVGGGDAFPGGCSYVGPGAAAPFADDDAPADAPSAWRDAPRDPPPSAEDLEREWSAFAALAEAHGANGDPVVPHREDALWAPRRAVLAARDFHQTHVPAVPFEVIREFLQKTNAAWLARERSHCARLHAAFQARIDDMFRKTQHGMPYDKVVAHRENAKLRDELKKARAKHLKGRPKKPVSRKFPDAPRRWFSDMRSAARDELLTASLNAVEKIAQDRLSDRSPSPTGRAPPDYSSRGPYSSRAFLA